MGLSRFTSLLREAAISTALPVRMTLGLLHIYIYIHMCVYLYMYMYTHTHIYIQMYPHKLSHS